MHMTKIKGYTVLCRGSQSSFGMFDTYAKAYACMIRNSHMDTYIVTVFVD